MFIAQQYEQYYSDDYEANAKTMHIEGRDLWLCIAGL